MAAYRDLSRERWRLDELSALAAEYPVFKDFLFDGIVHLLRFNCTWLQEDIADFLQYEPGDIMVQAQRSQAKTTITAFYVAWSMIHDPTVRALVFSAGGDMASEVAKWIVQIIMNWDILACMRPDSAAGDRASSEAFDLHWSLKGPEKSPSVACMGVTANMQGRRADILIADDVESSKNAMTQHQRDILLQKTLDFASICQSGRIIYLGTPQSADSIYNTLPGRGYTVRIWPGRYPTEEEQGNYGTHLAPSIIEHLTQHPSLRTGGGPTGNRGKPTDPALLSEEALTKKEIDQGPAYFQLQHMLDTKLSDEGRYPLKLDRCTVMDLDLKEGPVNFQTGRSALNVINLNVPIGIANNTVYGPLTAPEMYTKWEGKAAYIDPAGGGQNGDETVLVIAYFLAGRIFIVKMHAFPGGVRDDVYEKLTELCHQYEVQFLKVEKNFGGGAFAQGWRQYVNNVWNERDEQQFVYGEYRLPSIEDVWETGQKEIRVCQTLEPVIARGGLVFNTEVFEYDVASTLQYPVDQRNTYMLLHQLPKITLDRGSLRHDDRVDALAGAVRIWVDRIDVNQKQQAQDTRRKDTMAMFGTFDLLGQKPQGPKNRQRFKNTVRRKWRK